MKFDWKKLREFRKGNHLSIKYIMAKMKISQKTYWLWEHGKHVPSEENVRTLAKIVGIPVTAISDLKERTPLSTLSLEEVASKVIEPIRLNSEALEYTYDNVIKVISQLKIKKIQDSVLIKALVSSANIIFYVKDVELNYITVNDLFLKTLSANKDFIYLGKPDKIFFPNEEAKDNTEEDKQVLFSCNPVINREGFIPGTKRKKWGLISKHPIFDTANKVCGIVGTFVDITKRKQRETKRERLEKVINSINEGIWFFEKKHTRKSKMAFVNRAIENITGIEAEDFYKNSDFREKCYHPDFIKALDEFDKIRKYPKQIDYKIIRASDKQEKWIRETEYFFDNLLVGIYLDITEKKEIEFRNALLEKIISKTDECVWIGKDNKVFYVNNAFEKLSEAKREELVKKPEMWINLVHPDDMEKVKKFLQIEKYPKTTTYRIIRRVDKQIRLIIETCYKEDDNIYFGIAKDITPE